MRIVVKPLRMYISECGGYVCRAGAGLYEAWTADGAIHWRDDIRIKTWDDQKKPRHPMAYAVGSYSGTLTGQKKGSFTLGLLHCDVTMIVEPYKGNTIIESREVVFRRKVHPNHVNAWLRRIGIDHGGRGQVRKLSQGRKARGYASGSDGKA